MQSRRDLKAQHRENLMLECPDSQGESKHQGWTWSETKLREKEREREGEKQERERPHFFWTTNSFKGLEKKTIIGHFPPQHRFHLLCEFLCFFSLKDILIISDEADFSSGENEDVSPSHRLDRRSCDVLSVCAGNGNRFESKHAQMKKVFVVCAEGGGSGGDDGERRKGGAANYLVWMHALCRQPPT